MSRKIETKETSQSIKTLAEFTDWHYCHDYNYSKGYIVTLSGIVLLYLQTGEHPYAAARIVHKGRLFMLRTYNIVTELGWSRIAKRWAMKIWKTK